MRFRLAAVLVFLATLAAASSAAPADPLLGALGDAASVEAERLEVDVGAGSATLLGNVSLAKGDLVIRCPRIDLKFDMTPHIVWARGSGGVSADVRGVHAEAPDVEVDMAKQLVDLRGGVRLTRGQGWLQAERATIEIATAKVTLTQVKGAIPVPRAP
jgi:lipopolysaccharide export system protein LptA